VHIALQPDLKRGAITLEGSRRAVPALLCEVVRSEVRKYIDERKRGRLKRFTSPSTRGASRHSSIDF
jgi:hypothetical protein